MSLLAAWLRVASVPREGQGEGWEEQESIRMAAQPPQEGNGGGNQTPLSRQGGTVRQTAGRVMAWVKA